MRKTINTSQQKQSYDYSSPLDVWHLVLGDQVISDLVKTQAFQRLKKISFLGGIDYSLVRSPNKIKKRYTRYQHSLGVSKLSLIYAQIKNLSYDDRRLACISALLHDIGHAPLSHSLEHVFSECFGINHHIATKDIILGKVEIGVDVLRTLRWHNIDIDRVIAIIDGRDASFDGFFSGPINFDTIEGILRSYAYARNETISLKPDRVVKAASLRNNNTDRDIVDEFWLYKDIVYNTIINSEIGIVSDHICQHFMKGNIHKFSKFDYFTNEQNIFEKMPGLRNLLTSQDFYDFAYNNIDYPIPYGRRRFFIDTEYEFAARLDKFRYKQTKAASLLNKSDLRQPFTTFSNRDLFDDDGI